MKRNFNLSKVLKWLCSKSVAYAIILLFALYSQAAFAAPSIKLISPYVTPDQGWTVRGSISFSVKASDSQGISKVEFYVDNKLVSSDASYPYSWLWATTTYSLGTHTLKAIAFNGAGQTTTVQQAVTVAAPGTPRTADGSVVKNGLLPNIQPVINNIKLRDVSVCRGGDGAYYLTGTGSDNNAWYHNEGVNLWKSTDLNTWSYIGLIWSFEGDGNSTEQPWGELHAKPYRAVWAPEFLYIKGNYYFLWSYPGRGTKLMKSTTGKPEGPYVNNRADGGKLFGNIDGSLFEDTNGTVYLAYEYGAVVKLKADLSGFDGKVNYVGGGDEGAFLFKQNDKYYLSAAKFMDNGRYSSYIGISTSPIGPFSQWHEAIPCGGHNSYFKDSEGNWWGTFFGNDNQAPWREKPSIVKMAFNSDGTMKPSADQTRPNAGSAIVSGATYTITAKHSGKLLDVLNSSVADGANVNQYPSKGTPNQQFVVTSTGDGYYSIKAVHSGKSLDVTARSTTNGAKIIQWTSSTATNQQFKIVDQGGGYYQIIARHSSKCVEVAGSSTADSANVQQSTCTGGNNQSFQFKLVSSPSQRTTFDLAEASSNSATVLYPNPSTGLFHIKANGVFDYIVYDSFGNIKESGRSNNEFATGEKLSPGIYHIEIKTKEETRKIRLCKN